MKIGDTFTRVGGDSELFDVTSWDGVKNVHTLTGRITGLTWKWCGGYEPEDKYWTLHSTAPERGAGLKYDAGKPQARLLYEGLPHTFAVLTDVLTFGAQKYSANSWQKVQNGIDRYSDAAFRHMNKRMQGELRDDESGILHEAHELINRLFVLELKLRKEKDNAIMER